MKHTKSEALFSRARKLLPGGVNSPVRAFKAVGGHPVFIDRAEGAYLFDVDGNRYIDYVCSWGPLILGHAHPAVVDAIARGAARGTSYGAPSPLEVELAELVLDFFPNLDMVRMVNSGTEATMSALRLARAHTGRDLIAKFEGCYHGHVDSLLVKGGSGMLTLGIPSSPGVPANVTGLTLTLPFNDEDALKTLFRKEGDNLAAIILEPVIGNSGVILPAPGFLELLRALCTKHGVVLIFDEVMTGFRVARGGAQERYGIKPDLTTFGKVIGGGLPVGAYGGKRSIMKRVAPSGDVYQAGTLSGNPLAMAAGIATLKTLQKSRRLFDTLERHTTQLAAGLVGQAEGAGFAATANHVGSMFTLFFTDRPVNSPADVATIDPRVYGRFHRAMLERGVYLPPSQFEAAFLSTAHSKNVIEETLDAAGDALEAIAKKHR